MLKYLVRRVLQGAFVVLGVMLIVVLLFNVQSPDVVARALIGPKASLQQMHFVISELGLDQPVWIQFWRLVDNYSHGDFGESFQFNTPVGTLIAEYLPNTLLLVGSSTLLALVVALPLGVLQAVRRNTVADYSLTSLSFVLYAMPPFVLGPILIFIFAIDTHVFVPVVPASLPVWQLATDWRAMTLPVVTLSAVTIAAFSRYMRSSMIETLVEPYVRTARATGAGYRRVIVRHGLRNALIPITTLLGLSIPGIIGGAVITETVFNYPGMGYLITRAAERSDLATILATTVLVTVATVVGSLLADLCYMCLDPRIRYVKS